MVYNIILVLYKYAEIHNNINNVSLILCIASLSLLYYYRILYYTIYISIDMRVYLTISKHVILHVNYPTGKPVCKAKLSPITLELRTSHVLSLIVKSKKPG